MAEIDSFEFCNNWIQLNMVFQQLNKVDTAVLGQGHIEDIDPGFGFWHICHVDRHGHFTLKQLRLSLVNECPTLSQGCPSYSLTAQDQS